MSGARTISRGHHGAEGAMVARNRPSGANRRAEQIGRAKPALRASSAERRSRVYKSPKKNFVCLSVCLSVCLFVCLSGRFLSQVFSRLPQPIDMKICMPVYFGPMRRSVGTEFRFDPPIKNSGRKTGFLGPFKILKFSPKRRSRFG